MYFRYELQQYKLFDNQICRDNSWSDVLQPMSEHERNGEGFHYLVSYKRLHEPNSPELKQAVRDWRQRSLRAHTPDAFHAYTIFVQAVNNEGFAPVSQLQKHVAFSGEGSKYQIYSSSQQSLVAYTHVDVYTFICKVYSVRLNSYV